MSKPKPALYYIIVGRWWSNLGLRVIAVTTEKRNVSYGRYIDTCEATSFSNRDVKAKFKTEQSAKNSILAIKAVKDTYDGRMRELDIQQNRLMKEREEAYALIVKQYENN